MIIAHIGHVARCGCCGKYMLHTEFDALCVDCAADFLKVLVPGRNFWEDHAIGLPINNEFSDSEYNDNMVAHDIDDTDVGELKDKLLDVCDIGFEDTQPHARMYCNFCDGRSG